MSFRGNIEQVAINVDGEEGQKRFHWEVILRLGLEGWSTYIPGTEFGQARVFRKEQIACAKQLHDPQIACVDQNYVLGEFWVDLKCGSLMSKFGYSWSGK